jgi:hypothetical protein
MLMISSNTQSFTFPKVRKAINFNTLRSLDNKMLKHLRSNKSGKFYVLRGPNQGTWNLFCPPWTGPTSPEILCPPRTWSNTPEIFLVPRRLVQNVRKFYVLRGRVSYRRIKEILRPPWTEGAWSIQGCSDINPDVW